MARKPLIVAALAALGIAIAGCSADEDEHVWKDQTETIDKAREVENILKDAAGKKKEATEDSSY